MCIPLVTKVGAAAVLDFCCDVFVMKRQLSAKVVDAAGRHLTIFLRAGRVGWHCGAGGWIIQT